MGRRLVRELEGAAVLGRDLTRARAKLGDVSAFAWQPQAGPPPAEAFSGIDVVFHLAGEPVAEGRWTAAKKRAIRESRVEGTMSLVETLKLLENRPSTACSATVGCSNMATRARLTAASCSTCVFSGHGAT